MTRLLPLTMALLIIGLTSSLGGFAQQADDPGTELVNETIRARLVFETTYAGGATDRNGESTASLVIGETGSTMGAVGSPARLFPGLCMMLTMDSVDVSPEDKFGLARHLWFAEFEARAGNMRNVTLGVDWSRFDSTQGDEMERVRGDRRVLTLEQGERHLLDFVDYTPEENWYCGRNAAVYVEVDIEEDPALADERITYDLWLVIEDAEGHRIIRRALASGAQGEIVDLDLPDLRWPLPGAAFADGRAAELLGDFGARVRGRVRPDGSIAVDLRAARHLSVAAAGEEQSGGIGDGGRRVVRVQPGEAIELVLPETMGRITMFLPGTSDQGVLKELDGISENPPEHWKGYESRAGHVTVRNPAFFRETTMSLILTATREK